MAFETLSDMQKQKTAPITMQTFEPMLNHRPLEFEYNGTKFQIPLGDDVIEIFNALVGLINDAVPENSKYINNNMKKLAVSFSQKYGSIHGLNDSKGKQSENIKKSRERRGSRVYTLPKKEVNKLGRNK